MAPLLPKTSIDPRLLVSKGLDSSNFKSQEDPRVLAQLELERKKKAQQKVTSWITDKLTQTGQLSSPVVSPVVQAPVEVMKPMSQELPVSNPTLLPNWQPIIAWNVSQESLQPKPESKYMTKDQVRNIMLNAPEWVDKSTLLDDIVANWYILEWYNDPQSQITQAPVPVAPQITYGENKIQDQKQPWSLRRWIASLWGDMWNAERLNPIWKLTEIIDNSMQKIPTFNIEDWAQKRIDKKIQSLLPQEVSNYQKRFNESKSAQKLFWNLENFIREKESNLIESIVWWWVKDTWWPNVPSMIANTPWSLLKTASATARGITNPVDTLKWLYTLVATDEWQQVIKDRYGSIDNFAKSMDQDPVWVASDILTVVQWWAGLASKWAKLAWLKWIASKSFNLPKVWSYWGQSLWTLSDISKTAWWAADLWLWVWMEKLNAWIGNIASKPLRIAAKTALAPTKPLTAWKEALWIWQPKQIPVDRSNVDIKQPKDIVLTPQIEDKIQRSIKPTVIEKKWSKVLDKFNKDVVSSIDTVSQYLPQINLKDTDWNIVDRPIETIRDFWDSIDQAKTMVFKEYDSLKKQAWEKWVEVSLDWSIKELNKAKEWLKWLPWQKQVISYIDDQIADLSEIKKLSVDDSQKALQIYNEKLTAYYRNPQPNDVWKASIDALIANTIRQEMNNLIEWATWSPAYKVLKERYWSLSNVEKEVMKRAIVSGRWNAKSLLDFTDMFTADQAISAIINLATWNIAWAVKSWASALFINSIKNFYKNINSPDKNIKDLFDIVNNKRDQIFINKKPLNDNTMSDNIGVLSKDTLWNMERSKGWLQQNGLNKKPWTTKVSQELQIIPKKSSLPTKKQ